MIDFPSGLDRRQAPKSRSVPRVWSTERATAPRAPRPNDSKSVRVKIAVLASPLQQRRPRGAAVVARRIAEALAEMPDLDIWCLLDKQPGSHLSFACTPLGDWLATNPLRRSEPAPARESRLKRTIRELVPPALYGTLARLKRRRSPVARDVATVSQDASIQHLDAFTFVLSFWFFHEDWWSRPLDTFYFLPVELSRTHVVGWFHDAIPLAEGGAEKGVPADDFMKVVALIGLRADTIVCGSQKAREDLQHIYPEAASKALVIPYGHDAERFQVQALSEPEAAVRARFGISSKRYFVVLGTEPMTKNLAGVLKAFRDLTRRSGERPSLVIVGELRNDALSDAVEEARAFAPIAHVPYVRDEHLPGLLGHSEALVYASLAEGFGIPPLEAMSAGTLVVASDIAPLTEVCGSIPVYCDPRSVASICAALEATLAMTPAARATRIAAGRAHASRYTWAQSAEALLAMLRDRETSLRLSPVNPA